MQQFPSGNILQLFLKTKSFITTFISGSVMTAKCCYPVTLLPRCWLHFSYHFTIKIIKSRIIRYISVRSINTSKHFGLYAVQLLESSFVGFIVAWST